MKRLKLLLVGVDQSGWENWRYGPPAACYDPYGFSDRVPFQQLDEPNFSPEAFDGVVFTAPNYAKIAGRLIARAVRSGLPCVILKMRTDGLQDLMALADLSYAEKARLFVGDHYQYLPGARAVAHAVTSGLIGHVEYSTWRCEVLMDDHYRWAESYRHLALEDLAYHHLMTFSAVLGRLSGSVRACSFAPSWMPMGEKGYCSLLYQSRDGMVLNYETRWGAHSRCNHFFGEWLLEGKSGSLWTDGTRAVHTGRDGIQSELPLPDPVYSSWAGVVDHFHDRLTGSDNSKNGLLMEYGQFEGVLGLIYAGVASAESHTLETF